MKVYKVTLTLHAYVLATDADDAEAHALFGRDLLLDASSCGRAHAVEATAANVAREDRDTLPWVSDSIDDYDRDATVAQWVAGETT